MADKPLFLTSLPMLERALSPLVSKRSEEGFRARNSSARTCSNSLVGGFKQVLTEDAAVLLRIPVVFR